VVLVALTHVPKDIGTLMFGVSLLKDRFMR